MSDQEKIHIAKVAIDKNWDYETLKYSDYMYGQEDKTDDVYDLVVEFWEIGAISWNKKYGV